MGHNKSDYSKTCKPESSIIWCVCRFLLYGHVKIFIFQAKDAKEKEMKEAANKLKDVKTEPKVKEEPIETEDKVSSDNESLDEIVDVSCI